MLPKEISQVNTTSDTDQRNAQVVSLEGGGTVVVWFDFPDLDPGAAPDDGAVRAQVYDADGKKVGSEILVKDSVGFSFLGEPSVAALPGGGFVVGYSTLDNGLFGSFSGYQAQAQVFDASGNPVGNEIKINSDTNGDHTDLHFVGTQDGGFLAIWTDHPVGDGSFFDGQIKGQFFDADGNRNGSEFKVNTTNDDLRDPQVVALSNGNFLVTWVDPKNDVAAQLRGQIIDQNGDDVGSQMVLVSNTANSDADSPDVAALTTGGFAVVWVAAGVGNGPIFGSIQAQVFNNKGEDRGDAFEVDYPGFVFSEVEIAALPDGNFAIAHTAQSQSEPGPDISLFLFDKNGSLIAEPAFIDGFANEALSGISMDVRGNGKVVVTWTESDPGGTSVQQSDDDIYEQDLTFGNSQDGTNGDDTLDGTDIADTIKGGDGNDALSGELGEDSLSGGDGADDISAGGGDDKASGGNGNDTIRGGKGEDTLSGGSGNDSLIGQRGDDTLNGGSGNDRIKGGGDADKLNGGGDQDFLKGGTKADKLTGGSGDDDLNGNRDNDNLKGGKGDDRLNGGGEDDRLSGGDGDDRLKGGDGNDRLDGGGDNDQLIGDGGSDIFVFATGNGADTISDFDALDDEEKIDLTDVNAIRSFDDLRDNHMRQDGDDVIIETGGSNLIRLEGVMLSDLDAADFVF